MSTNTGPLVVSSRLALVLGALLLTCAQAQVPAPPSNQTDSRAGQTQSETADDNQNSIQAASETKDLRVDRAKSAQTAIREAPSSPPAQNVYALVPVSEIAHSANTTAASGSPGWMIGLAAIASSLAWPVALLVIVWRLLKAPQVRIFLTKLAHRATQINVAGLEIKLSEGAKATLEDLQKLIKQVPDTHSEWVTNSHMEAQFHQVVSGFRKFLCESSEHFSTPLKEADFRKFRFTLHVPDVLLALSMRQLVDYLGSDQGGSGRLFSARRGIVGLSWRLEESKFESEAYSEEQLVAKWGMTRVEAKDTKSTDKGVLLAFLIKSQQNLPLAVLYGDAEKSELFALARNRSRSADATFDLLDTQIKALSERCGLTSSLHDLEKARVKVRQVDIYRP